MEEVYNLLETQDLTPDLQMLSVACGIETVRKIIKEFNGLSFYIPRVTHMDSVIIKYFEKNKTKTNKEIARNLDISEQHLKTVLKRWKEQR